MTAGPSCPGGPRQECFLVSSPPGGCRQVFLCFCIPGFPSGSDGEESPYSTGDPGSIPESGRSLGEGIGCPLQYSGLENPVDRGAWPATGSQSQSQTQLKPFSTHHLIGQNTPLSAVLEFAFIPPPYTFPLSLLPASFLFSFLSFQVLCLLAYYLPLFSSYLEHNWSLVHDFQINHE